MARPQLGGRSALTLFVAVLVAFTVQSDLTTYLQTSLAFRRPYFLFYVAHSSFALVFPLHLLYLVASSDKSAHFYLSQLSHTLASHFSQRREEQPSFPYTRLLYVVLLMLLGLTGPGLLWYCSVSMSSISDITALWNTNAFWAYLFTIKIFRLQFQLRHLLAVSFACVGVATIVYGGARETHTVARKGPPPEQRLFGNLLALVASVWYGFFQVVYKRFIALPDEPEHIINNPPPNDDADGEEGELNGHERNEYHSILPFGLYSNFLLSLVGIATSMVLALPFPLLDYLDIEKFSIPTNSRTLLCVGGIAGMGLLFNSGFMILLGLWGPVITSVGGLLTVILVLISDVLFVGGLESLTVWTFLGSLFVVGGFAVLASELQPR